MTTLVYPIIKENMTKNQLKSVERFSKTKEFYSEYLRLTKSFYSGEELITLQRAGIHFHETKVISLESCSLKVSKKYIILIYSNIFKGFIICLE